MIAGGDVVKRPLEPQPSSARITIGDALPDIAVTYLDFVRDGKVYSAFADGDSADEVLENAYGYQLIDADGNVVSAEEACNKAGAYRIVPIAKLKVDENNWGSKYEIIGGAEGALEVFYPPAPRFTDVDYSSWYAPGVDFVASRGLMRGYEGTTIFGVGSALTRGELATILWRYACPDEAASYDPAAATDTTGIAGSADGMFYTAAANWAVEKGVIKGIERPGGALDFAADEPVTFEQLITILRRARRGRGRGQRPVRLRRRRRRERMVRPLPQVGRRQGARRGLRRARRQTPRPRRERIPRARGDRAHARLLPGRFEVGFRT